MQRDFVRYDSVAQFHNVLLHAALPTALLTLLGRSKRMTMQEDGTLGSIVDDTGPLGMILEALCGVVQAKQQSDDIRIALAESIELLVSP